MDNKQPRPRAKEEACDKAIKRTLAYNAVFKYPASKFQLYTYLITKKNYEDEFFIKSLRRLVKKKHIRAKNARFFLPGIRPISFELRCKYSRELLSEASLAFKMLESIPWIKLAGITGAVANLSSQKDDDIDVFIVTEKNRVWLTRLFVFLVLSIVNKYARRGEKNRKLCCNLLIDETSMNWGDKNLYIAREIVGLHPFINRDDFYFRFLKENDWVLSYFNNFKVHFPPKFQQRIIYNSKLLNWAEKIVRVLQQKYMEEIKTSEVTNKHLIHFRKHDHTKDILKDYEEHLLGLGR